MMISELIFIAEKMLSVSLLNMYRFAKCIPGRLQNFMVDRKKLLVLVILCFFIGFAPIVLVFVDFQTNNLGEFLIEESPALLQLSFDENTVAIHRSPFFIMVMAAFLLTFIVGNMVSLYIFIHMDRAIKQLKIEVTQDTYRLQRMLYLSVVIESLITVLTIVLPLEIFAIVIIFSIPYGSYVTHVLLIFMGFYTSLSAIAHFYFIKPFRKCALNVFNIVVRICVKRRVQVVFYTRSTVSIGT
uniref:G protein-coupled receptor n=1 Tax=Acrobeloides nanus TaxID=290746 RepID=A0A914CFK7_9BILA